MSGIEVDLDTLYDPFKHIHSSDDTSDDSDVVMTDFKNEDINKPITVNEIKEVIMNSKRNKSGSCDNILNEHIVHTADTFLPIYCDVFNCIQDSGHFPAQWTKGVVIPIYKNKGYKTAAQIETHYIVKGEVNSILSRS